MLEINQSMEHISMKKNIGGKKEIFLTQMFFINVEEAI